MKIERFNPAKHNIANFDCEDDDLNYYLHYLIVKEYKNRLSIPYVLINDNNLVLSFCCISSSALENKKYIDNLNVDYKKIPIKLLSRLGVRKEYKRKGLGSLLIKNMISMLLDEDRENDGVLLVVDMKSQELYDTFYKKIGFERFSQLKKKAFLDLRIY